MIQNLLIEFMGTVLICSTMLYTNFNPILVGLAHTSALYIGHDKTLGHFSPLTVLIQYSLGRLTLMDSCQYLAVQVLAALAVALTYLQL